MMLKRAAGATMPACRRILAALMFRVTLLIAIATAGAAVLAAQDDRGTVRIDGRPVFRVGPVDSTSATERARRVERRLATFLASPRTIPPARVERVRGDTSARMVTVFSVPVVTVGPEDAADNLTSVHALAVRWSRAVDMELQRAAKRRYSAGARFVAEVRGSVRAAFSRLGDSAIRVIPRALAALFVIAFFWGLASGIRALLRALFRRVVKDRTVESLIKQGAYYFVWTVGLVVAVDALGFAPQTVVTGLGLTGLALGFALKDIISNFVSGLLILALRPFELGDQIVVGETEGSVERIELRATHIRTYDGRLVLLPNAEVFTSRVTNNTASPVRRASVELFLGYDVDLAAAAEVVREAAGQTPGVLAEPPVVVRPADLGKDDVVLEVRFWTDSRRSDYTATRAEVRAQIVRRLQAAGVPLPDPDARHLVLRDPSQWRSALREAPSVPGGNGT